MKIYLDICCLKRPFDDQTQPRIATETAAITAILDQVNSGALEPIRSLAHDVENSLNPNPERARLVREWLNRLPVQTDLPATLRRTYESLRQAGVDDMDGFHLAWAIELGAQRLLTTDDRLISAAQRVPQPQRIRVMNPTDFIEERET